MPHDKYVSGKGRTDITGVSGDEPAGRKGLGIFVWVCVLLFIVYPLSMGPAMKLHEVGLLPKPVIPLVYKPIIFVSDRVPLVSSFFDWYFVKIWRMKS